MKIDFNIPMPLFPLSDCVLLPHTITPLHIFEQRYREMVCCALDGNGLIAMATFQGDTWREDYHNSPPIRPCVCVGYIVQHELLPDGRYNVLLQGICRARVIEEVVQKPYRRAVIETMEPERPMEIDLEPCRDKIEKLLSDPLLKQWSQVQAVRNWISREIPTVALLDQMVLTLCRCTDERYAMLEQPCPCQRAEWLSRHLVNTRKTLSQAQTYGPCVSEQGLALN